LVRLAFLTHMKQFMAVKLVSEKCPPSNRREEDTGHIVNTLEWRESEKGLHVQSHDEVCLKETINNRR
jgi:hypothetical protein